MPAFKIESDIRPTGDQPRAIEQLVEGLTDGERMQTLLGVTGSGKTFTMANVIEQVNRPTLVLAHNKTLAAQLYSEFKEFFPKNAVEYFVSYYDYYQPEAYVARTDTFIEKDSDINEEIDKLRHAATRSLLTRRDTLIVASVSCIFGLGSPEEYQNTVVELRKGAQLRRDRVTRHLIDIQYNRNDMDFSRGTFRVRGDTLEIFPAYEEVAVRVEFWGDEVERIVEVDPLTGEILVERNEMTIFPARHFVTTSDKLVDAIQDIQAELAARLQELESQGRLLEAQRLKQRTMYDLEMLQETGFCPGVENYSMHLSRRRFGEQPSTLLDYFPNDFLMFIDESHISIPQVRGMYGGDRSRKDVLVEHGFRLPSERQGEPSAHVRRVRGHAQPGHFRLRDTRPVRDGARDEGCGTGHPPHRPGRSADLGSPDQGTDRRSARRDQRADRPRRARARHHPDQAHG
jgi:excinuclease ABC subunit B